MFGMDRADSVVFSNGSRVLVKSAGSKLTGTGADWLIIDDPHPGRKEAESEVQRKNVLDWFFADCVSRLSPSAKILIIATRWHPRDLIGHLTSADFQDQLEEAGQGDKGFQTANFPAIAGLNDLLSREEGEALAPEFRPLSFLHETRAIQRGYEWESQYQGNPKTRSSGQVDLTNLLTVDISQVPIGLRQTRGWDLAITESQTADYTAGARIAYDPVLDLLYIMDMKNERMAWAKLRAVILRTSEEDLQQHGIARMAMEAVSGFEAVYRDVQAALLGKIIVTKKNPPRGGKLMRANPWLAKLEAGKVRLVKGPWNKDFREQLEDFPDGAHDDMVDAVSIAREELCPSGDQLLIA